MAYLLIVCLTQFVFHKEDNMSGLNFGLLLKATKAKFWRKKCSSNKRKTCTHAPTLRLGMS